MIISHTKHEATINDFVVPDEWAVGDCLQESGGLKDDSFPGCQFRLQSNVWPYSKLAVNIKVTGKVHWMDSSRNKSRCKIEFVGDGEPSVFTGGWIYHN